MSEQNNLLSKLVQSLEDIKADNIVVIDVRQQTSITDYMIICNGRASRHVKAIAEHIMPIMKSLGMPVLHLSGLETGDWVLVDLGDFVIHIMQPDSRAFYNLEGLWQDHNEQHDNVSNQ